MMMPATANTFVWYELMTTDMKAAEAFYGAVVGWSGQAFNQADINYTVMSAGDKMVAGIMTLPAEVCATGGRPGWVGYIGVDDVDAATASVKQAGGAVHRAPADIPNIGRFSVVADPQGAVFMLFKPMGSDNSPAPAGTPGHVGWRELYASDWQNALDFYGKQFGWTKAEAVDMGAMGIYQLFAAGGVPIGGMMNKPPAIPSPVWLYYFNVEAADAGAARVSKNGGQVLMGPHEVPGGSWIVQCMDPQGAMFALVAPKR
jgi:predicted enzyme related to lactoylglutathione lyase